MLAQRRRKFVPSPRQTPRLAHRVVIPGAISRRLSKPTWPPGLAPKNRPPWPLSARPTPRPTKHGSHPNNDKQCAPGEGSHPRHHHGHLSLGPGRGEIREPRRLVPRHCDRPSWGRQASSSTARIQGRSAEILRPFALRPSSVLRGGRINQKAGGLLRVFGRQQFLVSRGLRATRVARPMWPPFSMSGFGIGAPNFSPPHPPSGRQPAKKSGSRPVVEEPAGPSWAPFGYGWTRAKSPGDFAIPDLEWKTENHLFSVCCRIQR